MRKFLILIFSLIITSLSAQKASDTIQFEKIDYPFLEYLIKSKVDSVRRAHQLLPFFNDSLLYLAAWEQVEYLNKEQLLTHRQLRGKLETPLQRVMNYGGPYANVAELLGIAHLKTSTLYDYASEELKHTIYTYQQTAEHFINQWMIDPESRSFLLTRSLNAAGIVAMAEKNSNIIKLVAVFGKYLDEKQIQNSIYFHPHDYSNYKALKAEYDNQSQYPVHTKHAFKIEKNGDADFLRSLERKIPDRKELKLYVETDSVFLRLEDKKLLRFLLDGSKDGFVLEMVPKSHYKCNQQAYYQYPARRNNRCIFSGKIAEPVYRDKLVDNDDYRSRRRDIVLNLGVKPDLFNPDEYEMNALYLKDNKLSMVLLQSSLCGELLISEPASLEMIYPFDDVNYLPDVEKDTLDLKVFYDRGEVDADFKEIFPYIKQLQEKNYIVGKVEIEACASVEGTAEGNRKLFTQRVEKFVSRFRDFQDKKIELEVNTQENWKMFYEQIKSSDYEWLQKEDTSDIRSYVNDPENLPAFEDMLDQQRYASIRVIALPDLSDKSKCDYARSESILYRDSIVKMLGDQNKYSKELVKAFKHWKSIQLFMYQMYFKGLIKDNDLHVFNFPDQEVYYPMIFNQTMFEFRRAVLQENFLEDELMDKEIELFESLRMIYSPLVSSLYYYTILCLMANQPQNTYFTDEIPVKMQRSYLSKLSPSIPDSVTKVLKLNYHLRNSIELYQNNKSRRAKTSLNFLVSGYVKDTNDIVPLARHLLLFGSDKILTKFIDRYVFVEEPVHSALQFYLKYKYSDYAWSKPFIYYSELFGADDNF